MIVRHGINIKLIGIILVVFLAGAGATGAYYFWQNRPAVSIPQAVIDTTLFPIYVPAQLPAGFALDEKTIASNDGVLVFQLKDGTRTIAVSEQSMPANFDFTAFYEKQMKGARTIGGTPFHSVVGEMIVQEGQGAKFLSIRADATWVVVTGHDIRDDELEFIAKHLQKL
jgi:hypothetical protein